MYGDDTTVTYAASDLLELHQVIKTDPSNISEWMLADKHSLNANKSEFMVVGNTKRIEQLGDNIKCEIDGEHLALLHNMKYLEYR